MKTFNIIRALSRVFLFTVAAVFFCSTFLLVQVSSAQQTTEESEARLEKNLRYDGMQCNVVKATNDHECFFEQVWPAVPQIPLKESSIVIVGEVMKMQPFLSHDQTRVYTEITVRVEEVFKSPATLQPDQTLVIDRIGGDIKLPSGQLVHDGTKVDFLGKTHVGGRYVLFAAAIHKGKDFSLIKGYELRNGRVFKLTEDGTPSNALVVGLSQESELLKTIRTRAAKDSRASVSESSDTKSKLAISTPRLNSSLQLMREKHSKMNLEDLTRTVDPIAVLTTTRFSPPGKKYREQDGSK